MVRGVPVILDDHDTIQILELSQSHPTRDIPFYCVKFFFRKEHVLCSKRMKTYDVLSFAGQGGYGTVHKCRNPDGEQRLAVKVTKILKPQREDSSKDDSESNEVTVLKKLWGYVDQSNSARRKARLPDIDPHIVKLRDAWTFESFQCTLGTFHSTRLNLVLTSHLFRHRHGHGSL